MLILAGLIFQLIYFGKFEINTNNTHDLDKTDRIEFCDFRDHLGEIVRTSFVYSGVEEYWGINGVGGCKVDGIEFSFDAISKIEAPLFWRRIAKLHNNYWQYNLRVEAIGKFEVDSVNGFGHLNSNKARFTADKIVNSKLISKVLK